ncbi:hypothetical protein [Bacillus cereus]|uniref:hypothetical protein n=1 Tax=Bacillus cereus TaxID=1396 RepID=UPI00187ABE97|nr:hypothetical protein [Bacillus cereus]MBE7122998.1 hypothetical protein [Bacillus cereus]
MEKRVITRKEAVELYGSEQCKRHFEKYKKFTNKKIEDALIKTLIQYYKQVEKEKQGNSVVYILREEREKVAVREDNRTSNGAWSIPYTRNMDIMVVSVLEQGLIVETAQTLSKWSLDFGLITPKMYELLHAKYSEFIKEQNLRDLKNNNIICEGEERILNDFIHDIQKIQNQLAGTLNRMQKAKIIEYFPVYKGFVKEEGITVNLHENTVKKIVSLRRDLMKQYDVNEWYLSVYSNTKKSRNYYEEWEEKLSKVKDENGVTLGLSYWYKTYAIILKASEKRIISYLEKYNKDVIELYKKEERIFLAENEDTFHKERKNYVVKEAKKREDNFLGEKTKIITLDEDVAKIYGTNKLEEKYYNKKHDFVYDESYYALYFNKLYAKRIKDLQEYYGYIFK